MLWFNAKTIGVPLLVQRLAPILKLRNEALKNSKPHDET
jgi:hypothetical protein